MKLNESSERKNILIADFGSDSNSVKKIVETFEEDGKDIKFNLSVSTDSEINFTEDYHLVIIIDDGSSELAGRIQQLKMSLPLSEILLVLRSGLELQDEKIKLSIFDSLEMKLSSRELKTKIELALRHNDLRRELLTLKESIAMNYGFDNIIGRSVSIMKLKETIKRIAPTDIAVMINGSKGTGKELTARVIHHHSDRRYKKFTVIDCSLVSEQLFLTELFGSETNHNGIIKQTDGGSIFLKNADHIPLSVQEPLCRFLRDQNITNQDGSKTKVDVRIISSVSSDIKEMITTRKFSEELYFQLSVLPMELTDLMGRSEDIEELVDYFTRRSNPTNNLYSASVDLEVFEAFQNYNWPENILELKETIDRAVKNCQNNRITINDIIYSNGEKPNVLNNDPSSSEEMTKTKRNGLLDEGQRTLILKTLQINNWNFTRTAEDLGIGRTTLWRKVKKYNLKDETFV